jgi:hypothetical protein
MMSGKLEPVFIGVVVDRPDCTGPPIEDAGAGQGYGGKKVWQALVRYSNARAPEVLIGTWRKEGRHQVPLNVTIFGQDASPCQGSE